MLRHRIQRSFGLALASAVLVATGASAQSAPPANGAPPTAENGPVLASTGGVPSLGERLGPSSKRGNDGVGGIEKTPGNGGGPVAPKGPSGTSSPSLPTPTVAEDGPWTDLGQAKPGAGGLPALAGSGDGLPGSLVAITLGDGRPGAVAMLVLGTEELNVGFKGGVLVPLPQVVVLGLPLDASGGFVAAASLPDVPLSGLQLLMQMWIADTDATQGFASSNALRLDLP